MHISPALVLLVFLFSHLSHEVLSAEFKIAIIGSGVNRSFIDLVFDRRIKYNWRMSQFLSADHTITYRFYPLQSTENFVEILGQFCSEANISAVIATGSCRVIQETQRFADSSALLFVAIPVGLCSFDENTYWGVFHLLNPKIYVESAISMLDELHAESVAVYYDSFTDKTIFEQFLINISQRLIKLSVFQADTTNLRNSSLLDNHFRAVIKRKIRYLIFFTSKENSLFLLDVANSSGVLQQNYFWLIIDSGLLYGDILKWTPTLANVALLRGALPGVDEAVHCSPWLTDVFPHCNVNRISELEIRFVESVEILCKVISDYAITNNNFTSNKYSCSRQKWVYGTLLDEKLVNMNYRTLGESLISYNTTTRYLDSIHLEISSTFTTQSSPFISKMIVSAKYDFNANNIVKYFSKDKQKFVYPNTFTNFLNRTISICVLNMPPFFKITKRYSNNSVEGYGMSIEILDFLSEKLNFLYELITPADDQWGGVIANQSIFSGCVGQLQLKNAVYGSMPFTKTTSRSTVVDFAVPLFEEANAVLLRRPPPASKLWNVFTPLDYNVWAMAIGFLFISGLLMFLFAYFSPFSAWNLGLEFAVADEVWFQEYLWSAFGSFLQQGQDFYPFCMSARCLMAFWWLYTVVIFAAYTADLTAHLSVSVTTVPIRSLDDLAESEIQPIVASSTNIHSLLQEATSGVYYRLFQNLALCPTVPDCPDAVFKNGQACITDYTFLLPISKHNCSEVYLAEEIFNAATVALIYQWDAIYAEVTDFHMLKLVESGVMQKLFQKYFLSSDAGDCGSGNSALAGAIDLEGVGGAFVCSGVFYIVGFVVLFLEWCWCSVLKKSATSCPLF